MNKIRLNVTGIAGSHSETGAYVLMLKEQEGSRRIPVVIAPAEAQAIAAYLERYESPRPLTHDLFFSFAKAFNIEALEVTIRELKSGVFYSSILCFNGDREVAFDARTSDAVALALRFHCPIFTTEGVLHEAGIVLEGEISNDLEKLSREELRELLKTAIETEDYEKASTIRDELKRRDSEQPQTS